MTTIATVGYLNTRPLTDRIDRDRYRVLSDHPAAIAGMLERGEVDVALVPVAAVLCNPDLHVLPGFCIGADGPVTSVLLVAETPESEWTRVALDGTSRTSVALARLLLADRGLELVDVPPGDGPEQARGTTAAVVIGDPARALPDRLTVRVDLAERWREQTGLPFVFAVWGARRDLPEQVVADLQAAARAGTSRLEERYAGQDLVYLRDHLRYPLDDRALMGLRRFAALGYRAGLFPTPDVSLLGPPARTLPRPDVDRLLSDAAAGRRLSGPEIRALDRAPTSDLLAAAWLRRLDLHPEDRVTWLPVGAPDAGPPATAARVPLADLVRPGDAPPVLAGMASPVLGADEVLVLAERWGMPPSEALAVLVDGGLIGVLEGPVDPARWSELTGVVPLVGLTVLGRDVPDLERVRDLGLAAYTATGATATELLRHLALARLVLDVPHLLAPRATDGEAVAHAALHAGCDDYGVLDAEHVAAIEREILEAGFQPVRRGPTFGLSRGAGVSPALRSAP